MATIELTSNEITVLTLIKEGRKLSFFDFGWDVESNTWLDVVTGELAHYMGLSKQAVGGVLSSMIQKGVFTSDGDSIFLTEAALTAI